ncbi:tRNA uridine-5-carboxymethylaminomethyl(34) synthesis GTPase MnmE [Catenovulum sp. SM1970]|uniref:tRNA uridine-5-carboxymethylaminomethyl(34) synthesis GTPase MnmE n=1 Tax=Marinifaba aquimaris TaxID=2741323 RepID=UPI0015727893|nr:tRNA uridine-5-carboxymethylaminomethyl(34) synthesis GTPase MnmE [Marinifaba aquimaris]NTS76348.1 tRNA uridine-5-carboxymethylaminomethyl(34) synthesis GTPase MnmE [Marinifaba aquimaris]
MLQNQDSIAAIATAPGRGGVGIIRVSGSLATQAAEHILHKVPKVRQAEYLKFHDGDGNLVDQGIALFFKGPHSFTGEDVLELQGHGGPVILDILLNAILNLTGIRMANPGEFSERAFLNDKLDLAQAEAISDLIESSSEHAARSALQTLQGEFSKQVNALNEHIINLRMYVEAAIDFPEEEVDFLTDGKVLADLQGIIEQTKTVQNKAQQGAILKEGMRVVIAGRPNAGKSSLLNALSGKDSAIVTNIAGTTRDVLSEQIHIDGMPLHIIDTAGLRESPDEVEQIGIERAWKEIANADRVMLVVDANDTEHSPEDFWPEFFEKLPSDMGVTLVRNKIDELSQDAIEKAGYTEEEPYPVVRVSAKTHDGLDALKEHLKACMGYQSSTEGQFMARRRHLDAIARALSQLENGLYQLESAAAGELLAEELRLAQQHLNEITGEFTSDDLLGKIFSSFCIGK